MRAGISNSKPKRKDEVDPNPKTTQREEHLNKKVDLLSGEGVRSPRPDAQNTAIAVRDEKLSWRRQERESSDMSDEAIRKGKALTVFHEGIVPFKYKDSLGLDTAGVGHLCTKSEPCPETIDIPTAMKWYDKDYERALSFAKRDPAWGSLNDARRAALVDLMFNMGPSRWGKFKATRKALGQQKYEDVAKGLLNSAYARQTKQRAERIAEIFRTGTIPKHGKPYIRLSPSQKSKKESSKKPKLRVK
jgi:lysozyme